MNEKQNMTNAFLERAKKKNTSSKFVREINEKLDGITERLDDMISEGFDDDEFDEFDNFDVDESDRTFIDIEEIKSGVSESVKEATQNMGKDISDNVSSVLNDFEQKTDNNINSLKSELFERQHAESVTIYRNLKKDIETLSRQINERLDTIEEKQEEPHRIKSGVAVCALIFGILDFCLLGGYILYNLEFIKTWFGL